MMNKVEKGQKVKVHYVGTFDDGTEFDSSRARGTALDVEVGTGQVIPGFDEALTGMTVGETKSVKLAPTEGYGDINPEAFQDVPHTAFPEDFEFKLNESVTGQGAEGQQVIARISSLGEAEVTLDFNHPLAGKNLNFEIELVSIE